LLSWRSGRKIKFQNNSERLKPTKNNKNEATISDAKNILVFDHNNEIAGIADLNESFIIKPKVVFNAIG